MVKKWITIAVIFILLIVGCGLEYNYVNGAFDDLGKKLLAFEPMLSQDEEHIDTETNINYMEDLHTYWHKKVKILKALIWHTGIKDIEVGLSRIKSYTEENDYTEALTELQALIDYVNHYSEDFSISFENLLTPLPQFFEKLIF